MMKKGLCLLLVLCCLFLLNGCAGRKIEDYQTPASTLAPAAAKYIAPDGDGIVIENRKCQIYLPARDGLHLVAREVTVDAENLNDAVEKLMQQLLEYEGDTDAMPLGGSKPLELYGKHPIEISGGVCTVNLTRSAKLLKLSNYYKNCLAISTTLCELNEINGVNILVEDESLPLDTPGYLPMGTLMGHAGESLPVLWEQVEAKKTPMTPTDKDPGKNPLSALATLYYPLPDSRGMACTIRMVKFDGQTPAQLATALMNEVSNERRALTGGQSFPQLRDLLLHEPVTSDLADGGRILTLSLREDASSVLEAAKTDLACFAAAMTYTMTTFIPDISAVCIRIGDKAVTELKTKRFDPVIALSGLVKRSAVEQFLTSSVTVYFARNGILCECERPVAPRSVDSLRTQLCALMEGPDATEREEGIKATLPGTVHEDDILGISAEGDTLLVNLSENFRTALQEQGEEKETLACYSMVNTLCKNTGTKRVRFFFEGSQVEYVAGTIYWAGEFMYNIGLAEKGLG
ncbi:MAG: GerMN domain-containing protein [Clostridia bacterium]|nr:GerMN domain-containing protein [Clostridia bacterium]